MHARRITAFWRPAPPLIPTTTTPEDRAFHARFFRERRASLMTAHVRFQRRAARAAGLMTRYCPRDGLLLSFPGLAGWIDDQGDEQDVVVRAPVTGPVYPRLTLWLEMTGVPYGRTTR